MDGCRVVKDNYRLITGGANPKRPRFYGLVPSQPIGEAPHPDDSGDTMTTPDPTTESPFAPVVLRPTPAKPAAGAAFSAPASVDFPLETYPENAAMTAFGKRIQSDQDHDLLDVNISHVRDVSYQFECAPVPVFAPAVPVAAPLAPVAAGLVPVRAPRRTALMIVLGVVALGVLAAVGWLVLQM